MKKHKWAVDWDDVNWSDYCGLFFCFLALWDAVLTLGAPIEEHFKLNEL